MVCRAKKIKWLLKSRNFTQLRHETWNDQYKTIKYNVQIGSGIKKQICKQTFSLTWIVCPRTSIFLIFEIGRKLSKWLDMTMNDTSQYSRKPLTLILCDCLLQIKQSNNEDWIENLRFEALRSWRGRGEGDVLKISTDKKDIVESEELERARGARGERERAMFRKRIRKISWKVILHFYGRHVIYYNNVKYRRF